ncbi:MAG: TlpA disulfide reductase family protein [Oscillibacter sp.]
MKKLLSLSLALACVLSLAACAGGEIEATIAPFPEFTATDFEGTVFTNEMFRDYEATIVNVWSNGCGSCIEEMPELEEYYQQFQEENINLISVAISAGDSEEERAKSQEILLAKGVTYTSLIPDTESDFYKEFLMEIAGYPATYIVDGEGNLVGAPLMGVVKPQEDSLLHRLELAQK